MLLLWFIVVVVCDSLVWFFGFVCYAIGFDFGCFGLITLWFVFCCGVVAFLLVLVVICRFTFVFGLCYGYTWSLLVVYLACLGVYVCLRLDVAGLLGVGYLFVWFGWFGLGLA